MTSVALALVQEVVRVGGTVGLEGDTLRLSAPQPLPDHLRTRLGQHKAEIVALLSAAEPIQRAAPTPSPMTGFARIFRPRWPTASEPSSQLTVRGVCRAIAGRRSSAIRAISSMRMAACGTRPRLEHGRSVRLRSAGTMAQARPLGACPADGRPRDRRAQLRRGDDQDADRIGAPPPASSAGKAARRSPVGGPDLKGTSDRLAPAEATGPPIRFGARKRMAATFSAGPRRHPDHDHS